MKLLITISNQIPPFRLELLPLSRNNKPELIFMDQIEEVAADVPYKNESSIQIKLKDNIQRIILYNQVRFDRSVHKLRFVFSTLCCLWIY